MARPSAFRLRAFAATLALAPLLACAQHSGWADGQVNATMCRWEQPRAAVVKDTVYIDGGYLWWTPGMASGEYGVPTQDGNPLGLVLTLNFSTPFNSSQNVSTVFGTLSKAPNGGFANNFAPNYFDGAMLANDHEWFLYGGLITPSEGESTPAENDVLGYQSTSYGVEKPGFRPGFVKDELPDGVSRYIAFGGAASAPSENKAWYFGGMTGGDGEEIFVPTGVPGWDPSNHSDFMIEINMKTQGQETWKNVSLPDDIRGRANPEVVWAPIGEEGILVVLGGVTYPEFAEVTRVSSNEAASKAESDEFMSTIDIYDIANDDWYKQPTIGGPTARTRGCAVVSPSRDFSSINIYWYGGYDGLDPSSEFDDDVWILSLPSFMWMKVSSGSPGHGRAGHKCVMPYPDQMMVIGGYGKTSGETLSCLDGGVVEILNLTNGKWLDAYHPEDYHDYGVPEMIHLMIGGDWAGGATMLTPTPTGWADDNLAEVFATAYPTEKLAVYYPYPVDEEFTRETKSSGGWPSWATPVIIVLIVLLLAAVAFFVWFVMRKRKQISKREGDEGGEESGNRIISWIRGQPTGKAAGTVTTDETSTTAAASAPRTDQPLPPPPVEPRREAPHFEMADTSAPVEMMDTSPTRVLELANTGLSHTEVINKHTHLGAPTQGYGSLNDPSSYSNSGVSQADHASVNTAGSAGPAGSNINSNNNTSVHPPRPQPGAIHRPDSPSLGIGTPSAPREPPSTPPPRRNVSGVSALTSATGHYRGDSVDATTGEVPVDRSGTPLQAPGNAPWNTPVSPPQRDELPGSGRSSSQQQPVSPQQAGSPNTLRRSVFYENEDDMNERQF